MVKTKDQSVQFNVAMHCMLCMSTLLTQRIKAHNALNAVYIDTVNTGVCDFYTTLYTVYSASVYRASCPSRREGSL